MASPALICDTEQWKALQVRQLVASLALRGLYALISIRQQAHFCFFFFCFHLEQAHVGTIQKTHLRDLMADADRCKAMTAYDLDACARDISSLCVRACVCGFHLLS
jgi:glucose-6-phosphate isomerase